MNSPLSRFVTRPAYGATQLPRIAWYLGHSFLIRRLSAQARRGDTTRAKAPHHPGRVAVPDRRRIFEDMAILLQRDLANVEAGIYPLPADHDGSLSTMLSRSRSFFQ